MIIDHAAFARLDRTSFKAFTAAARALNFSRAAEAAAMTQSGVSQRVARLERQLGSRLFTRSPRQVRLTPVGGRLLRFVEDELERTARLVEEVHGEADRLSGKVRYAMPHSCLFTPHFPLLLEKRRRFPEVDLRVELRPNEEIYERLLAQEIDFGFITRRRYDPAVRFELFAREEYVLVGRERREVRGVARDTLLGRRFICYPGMKALFELWVRHYLRTSRLPYEGLRFAGYIDSLHGAITMLRHGVGVTVIPRHCVEGLLEAGVLHESPRPRGRPLMSEIHIVTLKGLDLPRRVRAVMDAFREMRKGLPR